MTDLVARPLRDLRVVTSQDTRQTNLRRALRALARGEARTRAELARLTGLTRPTASSIVADLVEAGLVNEAGTGTSGGGKPPTLLEVDHGARNLVAVDTSRRPVVAVLSDLAGTVLARRTAGDGATAGAELVEAVAGLVGALAREAAVEVAGVGVATPGLVTPDGVVLEAPNLDWHDVPLAAEMGARTGLPTWVANDADAAALVEYAAHPPDGAGLALVRIARGVGAGLVLGGRLHTGARAAAGEIGHLVVEPGGAACGCGNRGCLETVVSVPAIVARAAALAGRPAGGLPWAAEVLRRRLGDAPVDGALREAGGHLGGVLAHLVAIVDVTEVVLSLELEGAGEVLCARVREVLTERLLPGIGARVALRCSAPADDLLLRGAHALALGEAFGLVPS